MSPKIVNEDEQFIDYRLNQLGVRVWADACRLISRVGTNWVELGPRHRLGVTVPRNKKELAETEDLVDELVMTAFQYHMQHPGSDLVDVLSGRKPYANALDAAGGQDTPW